MKFIIRWIVLIIVLHIAFVLLSEALDWNPAWQEIGNRAAQLSYLGALAIGVTILVLIWGSFEAPKERKIEDGIIQNQSKPLSTSDEKKCPFCAELIKSEAILCRYCGNDLPSENQPKDKVEPKID